MTPGLVVVVNQLSRLVVDPERFPDDGEPTTAFGRGAVYTRTCAGSRLRAEPYPHAGVPWGGEHAASDFLAV